MTNQVALDQQLVILVGAARSGTKLLRDCLGKQEDVCVVPYDINFLWRLGNEGMESDEFGSEQATPQVAGRIRQQLGRWWCRPILVEKTVSNCLRVPFVHACFPRARFIHLVRDGLDTVESSHRQWLCPPDWRYLVGKFRAFPPTVAPRYAIGVARDVLTRQFSPEKRRLPVWGPTYRGIEVDLQKAGVLATCAKQWRICVETAIRDLGEIPADQRVEVRYEEFVDSPENTLKTLLEFCGREDQVLTTDTMEIRTGEIGKGLRSLSPEQVELVLAEIAPTQRALGYV